MSVAMRLIPASEIARVESAKTLNRYECLALIADMCRANTLMAVKRAGSGHLGSSFSAMDIVVWMYYRHMNTVKAGFDSPDRDIYFSSKGHDVPGLYSVLYALGAIPKERFLRLRRLGGLDGHPDVGIPGIEANSGSLGMGISKGRGMAWAKSFRRRAGRVFVLIGDGELQEGQNYEAFQTAVQQKACNLTVIVDHNKLQSDKQVCDIVGLGDLEEKFRAFGWAVGRCDGHDLKAVERALSALEKQSASPKILIADTIKGRGISFMEHPQALKVGAGYYRWHAGAPDDASFSTGYAELLANIRERMNKAGLGELFIEEILPEGAAAAKASLVGEPESKGAEVAATVSQEYVADAYGKALVDWAAKRSDFVVLDGDLAADCRVRAFELAYPERFIENGIAEQDMVSMAGGLARQGLLPVVNSFANFLAARANEQIYNNATEKGKIIYACHYAGVVPAGPGKSHQSIRDISLFAALPNMAILQPCNAAESAMIVGFCIDEAKESCMIRLNIGPSPRLIELPAGYRLQEGRGSVLAEGSDALMISYGPVMLHEALVARDQLKRRGIGLKVVNMPWLNRFDANWWRGLIEGHSALYVLEDHSPIGGLGDGLLRFLLANRLLQDKQFHVFGIEGFPACGTPAEALKFHQLDGASLAQRILATLSSATAVTAAA